MNVSMFVGTSQSQASSVLSKSQHDQQAYERMLQALQQFINEDRLSSTAYTNAKGFYSAVLTPLAKAGILLSEAVGEACQKFVQDYQSNVDSGDLKSDELEEKIRQLDMRISQLDSIRATIEGKDLADNFKIRQLNQNSQAKTLLEDSKKVLQKKLDKLLEFHGTSPDIFSAISELESIVNQGAAQAGSSFTGSGFSIPTDLGWTSSVAEKWQTRTDNIKKKEQEFHEKNIKELEKHNVYAWPYEDPETKEIKIMWFIDKDGVRVFDKELQDYVERYGKNLEGIYEVVGWDKIYELDLAARRRGDGKNYLNSNQLPSGWEWPGQAGAHVESAYWMANKTGLLDLALMAGLAYVNKKTKVSTSSNVANVLDDLDDVGKKNSAFGDMSPHDKERYNKFWQDVADGKSAYERLGVEDPISKLKPIGKEPYVFNQYNDDPAKTVFGPGKSSDPLKFQQIIDDLSNQGVEFNYKYDNAHKGYAPKSNFRDSQITIPTDVSYSGLLHEQQHYLDDLANGFPGPEYNYQDINRFRSEFNAYMKEIHLAEQVGNYKLANQLFENYLMERKALLGY
ncbi:hypothetical protein I6N96_10075 [Enterococcus sp. BWM-S5]|uniref:LXG domain-containing protein n=1 Tax=Enterococcus larvae TaxID=2794352 RepID=A0ABS4CJ37_9ENTE|nr:hypothetical protein [Enterococcus larvae]MBP1046635.1 hypothetical protein [Enterococcus larvae]